MIRYIKMMFVLFLVGFVFNGCIVGDVVALPFHVTGAVVNTFAPDVVGDSISAAGDAVDVAIPF